MLCLELKLCVGVLVCVLECLPVRAHLITPPQVWIGHQAAALS